MLGRTPGAVGEEDEVARGGAAAAGAPAGLRRRVRRSRRQPRPGRRLGERGADERVAALALIRPDTTISPPREPRREVSSARGIETATNAGRAGLGPGGRSAGPAPGDGSRPGFRGRAGAGQFAPRRELPRRSPREEGQREEASAARRHRGRWYARASHVHFSPPRVDSVRRCFVDTAPAGGRMPRVVALVFPVLLAACAAAPRPERAPSRSAAGPRRAASSTSCVRGSIRTWTDEALRGRARPGALDAGRRGARQGAFGRVGRGSTARRRAFVPATGPRIGTSAS